MNAMLGSFVSDLFEQAAARKKSLRGNAADISAGTSGCRFAVADPIINAAYRQAELCCSDRRNISSGTGADDDEVNSLNIIFLDGSLII